MLEYNPQYETHPLYNHFKSWIDMEESYQESYYIMNTALYAAEDYIEKTFNIVTRATKIQEYFGSSNEDYEYTAFNLQNLLTVYTDAGYELPAVAYFNTTDKVFEISEGPFSLGHNKLTNVSSTNLNIEYITGYIFPEYSSDTPRVPEGNDVVDSPVTTPTISNVDGSPLYSPLSTSDTYYDLHVIGDEGSTVYINGTAGVLLDAGGNVITAAVSPRETINEDRIGKVTLTLVDGINTFTIDCRDDASNISNSITIVINKQVSFNSLKVELVGKDLATNDGSFKLLINSIPGSTINVNGIDEITYSTGLDIITTSIAIEGISDITITTTTPSGTSSSPLVTHILYDSTLEDNHVDAVNALGFKDITMPQDMLVALLMIAQHYFRIALYKNEDTQSYGDNVSNRVTFVGDRFPKDANKILSKYLMY